MKKFVIYTDGSCNPNPGPCSWGAILLEDGVEAKEAFAYIGKGTNNIAEITAAVEGLRLTPPGSNVDLASDSQYVIKGISEWRKGWEQRSWKTSAKKDVENISLWKTLFAEVDKRTVSVRWVKGHDKDHYNNVADRLADEGMALRHLPESQWNQIRVLARQASDTNGPSSIDLLSAVDGAAISQREERLARLLHAIGEMQPAESVEFLNSVLAQIPKKSVSYPSAIKGFRMG